VIDTARSLTRAARAAKESGATNVDAFASHAVLGQEATARIKKSALGQVVVLNTVPISNEDMTACTKFAVVDVAPIVAALIADLHFATD